MFSKWSVARTLFLATVSVVLSASASHAQPAGPQGTGSFNREPNGYEGYYFSGSSPSSSTDYASGSYQSFYPPEPMRSGWQLRSDGWYYYWNQNQVVGAYDADNRSWYDYRQGRGWGKAATPPWKRR